MTTHLSAQNPEWEIRQRYIDANRQRDANKHEGKGEHEWIVREDPLNQDDGHHDCEEELSPRPLTPENEGCQDKWMAQVK